MTFLLLASLGELPFLCLLLSSFLSRFFAFSIVTRKKKVKDFLPIVGSKTPGWQFIFDIVNCYKMCILSESSKDLVGKKSI
jgi:hypothetical protein